MGRFNGKVMGKCGVYYQVSNASLEAVLRLAVSGVFVNAILADAGLGMESFPP